MHPLRRTVLNSSLGRYDQYDELDCQADEGSGGGGGRALRCRLGMTASDDGRVAQSLPADLRADLRVARGLPSELALNRSSSLASRKTFTLLRQLSARTAGSRRVVSDSEQELTDIKATDATRQNLLRSQELRSDRC